MKSVRERMDILSAYREVGTYHGAAEICSTTPKTLKRVVATAERSEPRPRRTTTTRSRTSLPNESRRARAASAPNGSCPPPTSTGRPVSRRTGLRRVG